MPRSAVKRILRNSENWNLTVALDQQGGLVARTMRGEGPSRPGPFPSSDLHIQRPEARVITRPSRLPDRPYLYRRLLRNPTGPRRRPSLARIPDIKQSAIGFSVPVICFPISRSHQRHPVRRPQLSPFEANYVGYFQRSVLVGRGRHAPQRGPTRRPCPQLSVSAGPIQPTSPLARERCAASFCTFCGISLSWPFCGTRAEIQPPFQRDILRSLSGV